ncbi:hypothetical protein Y032_0146g2534 [Ancylostoma ceylanicum]|uniref:Uncharacterized protein n=1 Tax=Ancylostoma ceylanicum TaxID=53326 RepID=A0A016T2D9_9BILA|nr:hypothetical protein Y032_0146g2534 [Ancylostoma ceylanicum]
MSGFPSVKLHDIDRQFLREREIIVSNPKLRGEIQTPHILVRLDHYYNFIVGSGTNTLTPSGLHIAKTIFCPSLYGRGLTDTKGDLPSISHNMTAVIQQSESELLNNIFELKGMGISANEYKGNDDVIDYFKTYSEQVFIKNGYITAPFPLKNNITDSADNYATAFKRLVNLHEHLQANPLQKE